MAVTPTDTNRAFLREVDEELRREQVLGFGRRWGAWVGVAMLVVLAVLGGTLWWRHHREAVRGQQGEKLLSAYESIAANQPVVAGPALADLAAHGTDGYRATARFAQADILLRKKDEAGATRLFAAVAGDASMPQPMRDLALVRQTATEYDRLKPDVVVSRLRGLAVRGGPWFGSAGELVAIAYLRQGRRALAAGLFGQIAADDGVPDSIRARSLQMAGALNAGDAAPAAPTQDKPAA